MASGSGVEHFSLYLALQENPALLLLQQFVSLKPCPAADQAVLDRNLQLIETFLFDLRSEELSRLYSLALRPQ